MRMSRSANCATSAAISLGSGFRKLRSSTTGRPEKKPGEFFVHPSRLSNQSASGASGASAKARKERAGKRIDFFWTGAAPDFSMGVTLFKGGVLTDLLTLFPAWLMKGKFAC